MNRSRGITFVALDRSRSLTEQGPYDAILHKVYLSCMVPLKTVFLFWSVSPVMFSSIFRSESLFSRYDHTKFSKKYPFLITFIRCTFKTLSMSLYSSLTLQTPLDMICKYVHVRGCSFSYLNCPDVKLCLLAELPGEWQYAVEL